MKPANTAYAAHLRRYRHLAKTINRMIRTGSFRELSLSTRKNLLATLKRRLQAIRRLLPEPKWKQALAGFSLLTGLSLGSTATAQTTFAPPVAEPFGLSAGLTEGFYAFTDIDDDGDRDLFMVKYDYYTYSREMVFYENIGTPQAPAFASDASETNPFGIQLPFYITTPAFADLDNDGDQDLLLGGYYGNGIYYLQNTGTPAAPSFAAPVQNPFGLQSSDNLIIPTLADIDSDGDQDMISTDDYGNFRFFKNTGTAQNPSFAPPLANPFGLSAADGYLTLPLLTNLDGDGDSDLIYTSFQGYSTAVYFAENEGTAAIPAFNPATLSPFGISTTAYIAVPAVSDIDSDGDQDLFLNDYIAKTIYFYENTSITLQQPPLAADSEVTVQEDQTYFFKADDFNFSDANTGDQLQAVEIINMLPQNGVLKLNDVPVLPFQVIAAADIPQLSFTPALDGNGAPYAAFTFLVSDGTDWSANGYQMTINVQPVNDAPESEASTVSMAPDGVYSFSAQDFPFSDVDGDNLGALRVTEKPDRGILRLNGVEVTVGQDIPAAQLGQLTFTPVVNETGTPYTTFQFQVSDGISLSTQSYVMTINVGTVAAGDFNAEVLQVRVYPNPAQGRAWLEVSGKQLPGQSIEVQLLDVAGRLMSSFVMEVPAGNVHQELNLTDFSPGLYQLRLAGDDFVKVVPLVIKR